MNHKLDQLFFATYFLKKKEFSTVYIWMLHQKKISFATFN